MSLSEDSSAAQLSYSISEKPPFAVVIFVGELTKATISVLDDCQKDLSERAGTLFVLVMRDVMTVDLKAFGALTQFQKLLRDKGELRICSVKSEIRKFLIEMAVIRDTECFDNLAESLESLKCAQAKMKLVK